MSRKVWSTVSKAKLRSEEVLLARAAVARDVIPDALRAVGATLMWSTPIAMFCRNLRRRLLREALEKGIDAATFTSSSSVTHLAEAAKAAGLNFPFAGVAAVSIGPITSKTLREFGWEPAAEARVSDVPGLAVAVEQVLRS